MRCFFFYIIYIFARKRMRIRTDLFLHHYFLSLVKQNVRTIKKSKQFFLILRYFLIHILCLCKELKCYCISVCYHLNITNMLAFFLLLFEWTSRWVISLTIVFIFHRLIKTSQKRERERKIHFGSLVLFIQFYRRTQQIFGWFYFE